MKRRRRSTPRLHQIILDAAKEVRKKKITFEKEASACLSQALGFEVTVKIKKQPLNASYTPTMKRMQRKDPAVIAEMLNASFALNDEVEL